MDDFVKQIEKAPLTQFLARGLGNLFGAKQLTPPEIESHNVQANARAVALRNLLGLGSAQGRQLQSQGQPTTSPVQQPLQIQGPRVRTQQEIQSAPFKLYEDSSFQGDPTQYQQTHPNVRFYEDNTFSNQRPPFAVKSFADILKRK